MANRIPFVAYFKIIPEYGSGKRFEIQRSRDKISAVVYMDLMNNFQDVYGNVAEPGGNAHLGVTTNSYSFSLEQAGAASKPQFGDTPDIITIVGFFDSPVVTPYNNTKPVISVNKVWTGPATGAPGYHPAVDPNAGAVTAVNALRTALEASITSVDIELIRLELNGVAWGREAKHFPRRALGSS